MKSSPESASNSIKELSIIIVNWNSADYLRECLTTVYAETKGIDFETIVVDNDPSELATELIRKSFPGVILIRMRNNCGFAKANNLGFQASSGRLVLFLNPDTEIVGSAIQAMALQLQSIRDAGIVGCKLLNTDRTVQTSCIQRFPTILNQVFGIEWLRIRTSKLSFWGIGPLFDGGRKVAPVDVISGACLMIKREIFERIGHFSEEFFMYAEDMDLCYRVRKAGLKAYCVSGETVVHHGGGSSQDVESNRVASVRQKQAMFEFFQKTRGSSYGAFYRAAIGMTAVCRVGVIACLRPFGLSNDQAFTKWTAVLRWSLGLQTVRGDGVVKTAAV